MRAEFVGGQIFCCVGALAIGVCDWCVCVWMYGCVRVHVSVCECVPGLMVAKSFAVLVPWLLVCVFCVCVYGCMCMCVCVCVYVSACGV